MAGCEPIVQSAPPQATTLIIACGALAHELVAINKANHWTHFDIQCLPAHWHNTPDKITPAIEKKILENREHYQQILVAYGDCGTGGQLDALLSRYDIARLPGPHCYSFFAGEAVFEQFVDEDMATFYLTDYLATHFDRLILDELGIRKHPELLPMYFGNYKRLLYLTQQDSAETLALARKAAQTLGLQFKVHKTGLKPITNALEAIRVTLS